MTDQTSPQSPAVSATEVTPETMADQPSKEDVHTIARRLKGCVQRREVPSWGEIEFAADVMLAARSPTPADRAEIVEECAKVADGWLAKFGHIKPEFVDARAWANDAVRDIATAIRSLKGSP